MAVAYVIVMTETELAELEDEFNFTHFDGDIDTVPEFIENGMGYKPVRSVDDVRTWVRIEGPAFAYPRWDKLDVANKCEFANVCHEIAERYVNERW